MIQEVDTFLKDGCGRCKLYRTPDCKVHSWHDELLELRRIVLSTELKEEYKWSQPCYTIDGKNVLIVTAFKQYACISFFSGSLLSDDQNKLVIPGQNSQAARQLRFTSVDEVLAAEQLIKEYVHEAIQNERAGRKVKYNKEPEALPQELVERFEYDIEYKNAFEGLTPGRQRGYLIHFSQAKQSATRANRIEKSREKVLLGKGWNER